MNCNEIVDLSKDGERELGDLELPSFVWIDSFISLAGSVLYDKDKPNDLDLIVRAKDDGKKFFVELDPSLRIKIDRILNERFGDLDTHWIGSLTGPNWRYLPLYDLVLVPHEPFEVREINEPEFASEFYKLSEDSLSVALKDPSENWQELFADLRFLGNVAYPRLKVGKAWGDWSIFKVLRTFAKIVDALRSIYFPIIPPNEDDPEYSTSYWECYRRAEKYMRTKPPDDPKEWDEKRERVLKDFSISRMFIKSEDERIVSSVVYAPNEVDSQGHYMTEEDIRLAAYSFMEGSRKIKLFHQGSPIKARILENYLAPVDFSYGSQFVPKGSWVLTIRVLDDEIWRMIKEGELEGFSMAGVGKLTEDGIEA